MKKYLLIPILFLTLLVACNTRRNGLEEVKNSGNPLFEGWYADPEAIIYDDTYWIFPTYSQSFSKQVFFDCFSSKDLVSWTKHSNIIDTT